MKIHVIAFGKLKTPGLRETADYYVRNSKSWGPVLEHELKPAPLEDKSPASRLLAQNKDELLLTQKLTSLHGKKPIYFLLDELGKSTPTQTWAELLEKQARAATTELTFIVGSSVGFSESIRAGASGLLSLGAQTLPHELARVVLFEQLYRALSLIHRHPYHNEGS